MWVDLLIVALLFASVVSAFRNGIVVEVCSLAGLLFGLSIAARDYPRLMPWLMQWISNRSAAEFLAFLLVALGVAVLASLVGRLLRGTVKFVGLGWMDRFLGALFGLLKGCVLVMLVVMAIAAFFPQEPWFQTEFKGSRLAMLFLEEAHHSLHFGPFDFGRRVREGVQLFHATTNL